jgi:hypothetical protein
MSLEAPEKRNRLPISTCKIQVPMVKTFLDDTEITLDSPFMAIRLIDPSG